MQQRRTIWPFIVGVLVLIAVLVLIGQANARAAWSEGYMMGRLSAGAEGEALWPYMAGYGQPAGHSILPWVVGILLVVAGLAVVGRFLRFQAWRHWQEAGGPERKEAWARHWWPHGPTFHGAWPAPPAGPAAKAEPEAQSEKEAAP